MGIPGNTQKMPLGYQNMYLLIKNMCQLKNQDGNTGKNVFGISEYVLTNQNPYFQCYYTYPYSGLVFNFSYI